jgi:hypothetical protein
MSERDTDIDFDFFDEPETREATQRRTIPPRRAGGPPRRPPIRPRPGVTPLLRLVGLIALAIFLVVLLVLWVDSCRGASKHSEYANYVSSVKNVASGSAQIGRELNDVLTTPGIKTADLETKLLGLAEREDQYAQQAERINPPGPLRNEHVHLIEVLQLRSSGLSRLADAFRRTAASKQRATAGALLSEQAQLLVASDVNYDFYVKEPVDSELKRQGITNVIVPDSNFVQNPDLASTRSMQLLVQRIRGAATGGTPTGVHGTGIVSVRALPSGTVLSTASENTVRASTQLAFAVEVKDTGEAQEVHIPVTLTIQASPKPIVKRQTIDLINVGETKTLNFPIPEQPPFGVRSMVRVDVKPVRGERTTTNNSFEYPVVFSYG